MARPAPLDERARADVLGGLLFSGVETATPLATLRAAQWFNLSAPLQAGLPFFLVHDVGLALAYGTGRQVLLRTRTREFEQATQRGLLRRSGADEQAHAAYVRLLSTLARSTLAVRMGTGGLTDNVMGALIAKVLEPVRDARGPQGRRVEIPLDPALFTDVAILDEVRTELAQQHQEVVRRVAAAVPQLVVAAEQVDLDTLKFMQVMGGADTAGDSSAVLDFYRVLESPQAHDIVNFCLDLVPQVLETSRSKGAQTFAMGGYASIETKGNLDSLLPSELAYDDFLFEQRWSENELLFFGREKDTRERQRLHYLLVDASAAMRGLRTTFARGLALALAKKLTLRGESVWLRFFDSRLHERLELTSRVLRVPQVLTFRSERGRNAGRVFEELDLEVARLVRDEGRDVILTVITHGRLAIPEAVVERLASRSSIFGVFVLPSRELELPFARLLTRTHIVGAESLVDPQARTAAALSVLQGT